MIEKNGTGIESVIEKSGTGIGKSGTGIEKSGTGIEKSGTGIERSGTGLYRLLLTFSLALIVCAGNVQAAKVESLGSLQLVTNGQSLAVSWIFDGSVFSGVAPVNGSFTSLALTEVALATTWQTDVTGGGTGANVQVTGGGTGSNIEVTGGGTGSSIQVTGGGTGNSVQVTGGGTGNALMVTGGGTGSSVNVTGGGTGFSVQVTGGGTGHSAQVTGGGTGYSTQVTGGGTGAEAITITLPEGTGLTMEVSLGCGTATVALLDSNFAPIASFGDVPVLGDRGDFCTGTEWRAVSGPGRDFRSK